MGVHDYDATPGNNTSISGTNVAENCPAGNVNDAIRQLMADLASFVAAPTVGAGPSAGGPIPIAGMGEHRAAYGGTANAITLTTGVSLSAVPTGYKVRFRATSANTGSTTIDMDGIGTVTCKTITGENLPAGYIRTDVDTEAVYDGTNWVLDRAIETGEATREVNVGGVDVEYTDYFTKYADGTLTCFAEFIPLLYESSSVCRGDWEFPSDIDDSKGWAVQVTYVPVPITSDPQFLASTSSVSPRALVGPHYGSYDSNAIEVVGRCLTGASFESGDYLHASATLTARWY